MSSGWPPAGLRVEFRKQTLSLMSTGRPVSGVHVEGCVQTESAGAPRVRLDITSQPLGRRRSCATDDERLPCRTALVLLDGPRDAPLQNTLIATDRRPPCPAPHAPEARQSRKQVTSTRSSEARGLAGDRGRTFEREARAQSPGRHDGLPGLDTSEPVPVRLQLTQLTSVSSSKVTVSVVESGASRIENAFRTALLVDFPLYTYLRICCLLLEIR